MVCTVENCDNPYYCKGSCAPHYGRWRRHGDPLGASKPGPKPRGCNCSIPECEAPTVARGLCRKHYMRMSRHGDPLATSRVVGDDEARWWSHVDRRGDSECWPWTGHIDHHGYGRFWTGGTVGYAARWGYEHFVGPLPVKWMPDHTCHDPQECKVPHTECPHRACCNWTHLEPVTNRVNVLRGAKTKLSDEQVELLYVLYRNGVVSMAELAATSGVNRTTLHRRFRRLD
jgi:Winged helix-turn-helix DNA-binding